MNSAEIIEKFDENGIECVGDGIGGLPPVYDMVGDKAYMISETGGSVVEVGNINRLIVPFFENPTEEHIDSLLLVAKGEKIVGALLSVRSENIVGLVIFVEEEG